MAAVVAGRRMHNAHISHSRKENEVHVHECYSNKSPDIKGNCSSSSSSSFLMSEKIGTFHFQDWLHKKHTPEREYRRCKKWGGGETLERS